MNKFHVVFTVVFAVAAAVAIGVQWVSINRIKEAQLSHLIDIISQATITQNRAEANTESIKIIARMTDEQDDRNTAKFGGLSSRVDTLESEVAELTLRLNRANSEILSLQLQRRDR